MSNTPPPITEPEPSKLDARELSALAAKYLPPPPSLATLCGKDFAEAHETEEDRRRWDFIDQ
jgi:hypothetical protein